MQTTFPALISILLLALPAGSPAAERMAQKPNVILLLLDDAGWTDTGNFGGRMKTPHLDQLAAEGMRFTDCHSPAPNCSPARAGFLTLRNPTRACARRSRIDLSSTTSAGTPDRHGTSPVSILKYSNA